MFGLTVTAVLGLFFSTIVNRQWGDLLTAQQMKLMPEFNLNGRREYFGIDTISFYFRGVSDLRAPPLFLGLNNQVSTTVRKLIS